MSAFAVYRERVRSKAAPVITNSAVVISVLNIDFIKEDYI
jgi:hypothetical protein